MQQHQFRQTWDMDSVNSIQALWKVGIKTHFCSDLGHQPDVHTSHKKKIPESLSAGSESAFVNGATKYDEFGKHSLPKLIHTSLENMNEWKRDIWEA